MQLSLICQSFQDSHSIKHVLILYRLSPDKNKHLTREETTIMQQRVHLDRGDAVYDPLTWETFWEYLKDWKHWAYGYLFMSSIMWDLFWGHCFFPWLMVLTFSWWSEPLASVLRFFVLRVLIQTRSLIDTGMLALLKNLSDPYLTLTSLQRFVSDPTQVDVLRWPNFIQFYPFILPCVQCLCHQDTQVELTCPIAMSLNCHRRKYEYWYVNNCWRIGKFKKLKVCPSWHLGAFLLASMVFVWHGSHNGRTYVPHSSHWILSSQSVVYAWSHFLRLPG